MTNKEAKEQAIKAAWVKEVGEETYKFMAPFINSYGWLNCNLFSKGTGLKSPWYKEHLPYDLRYVRNNNGWTRIEPDGSNLPDRDKMFDFCINNETCFDSSAYKPVKGQAIADIFYKLKGIHRITHYKERVVVIGPIF